MVVIRETFPFNTYILYHSADREVANTSRMILQCHTFGGISSRKAQG